MSDSDLLALVADIARQLPAIGANELADSVRTAGSAEKLTVRADGLPTHVQQKRARELAKAWTGSSMTAEAIAASLVAAQSAGEAERLAETIDVVWTGPKSTNVPVARNSEALHEIVASAEQELLIVSYATYQVPELVKELGKAVDRGVDVTMVLEFHGDKADQPTTWDPVKGLGGKLPDGVALYGWPVELREKKPWGKVGYLHVKCAVADRDTAFVSSANLTVYAMEMNMELGVVVRGGNVPERIADHFRALIGEGILQRWNA